ncbi:MAG TPA: hypothetical protein VHC22_28190 [Pirellulales bacterium]|nr:hypothetical protein [Pirellulales bacterium]
MSHPEGNSHLLPGMDFEPLAPLALPDVARPAQPTDDAPAWHDSIAAAFKKGRDQLYRTWSVLVRDRAAGKAIDEAKAVKLMEALGYTPADFTAAVAGHEQRIRWADEVEGLPAALAEYNRLAEAENALLVDRPRKLRAIKDEIVAARAATSVALLEVQRLQAIDRNLRLGRPMPAEIGLRETRSRLANERDRLRDTVAVLEAEVANLTRAIPHAPPLRTDISSDHAASDLPGLRVPYYTQSELSAARDLADVRLREALPKLQTLDEQLTALDAQLAELARLQLKP